MSPHPFRPIQPSCCCLMAANRVIRGSHSTRRRDQRPRHQARPRARIACLTPPSALQAARFQDKRQEVRAVPTCASLPLSRSSTRFEPAASTRAGSRSSFKQTAVVLRGFARYDGCCAQSSWPPSSCAGLALPPFRVASTPESRPFCSRR